MKSDYDIVFVGHVCIDNITPYKEKTQRFIGSAVLCGAMAAIGAGAKVAVVTRLAKEDQEELLEPFKQFNIDTFVSYANQTTEMKVDYPTEDLDYRIMHQIKSSGFFEISDIPEFNANNLHLAGITNQEFDLGFIKELKKRNIRLSTDMQSYVRQVNPESREISYCDVSEKKEIISLMDLVKLDVVEAKILTGMSDLKPAAEQIEKWGCSEIMITANDGVLLRSGGKNYFEPFKNNNNTGRTGRGDTTFAAFLAHRLHHDVESSVKFAAALVSLKMETPGPFKGTIEEVNKILEQEYNVKVHK